MLDINLSDSVKSQELLKRANNQKSSDGNCDDNNNSGQNGQLTAQSDDLLSNYSQRTDIVLVSLNDDSDIGEDGKLLALNYHFGIEKQPSLTKYLFSFFLTSCKVQIHF